MDGRISRAEAITKGAIAVGGILGLDAIGPFVARALADLSGSEREALNVALSFEYVQSAFYGRAKERMKGVDEVTELIDSLVEQEQEHRAVLIAQIKRLGVSPEPEGDYAFAYFPTAAAFLAMAATIELAAVHAYNGIVPAIESAEARTLVASIAQVEGRHAAAVQLRLGEPPAPQAFDFGVRSFRARASIEKFTGEY